MRTLVAKVSCSKIDERHVERGFCGSVAAAEMGIWQAWWGQGRRGGVGLWD